MSDNFSDFDNLIDLFTTVGSKLLEKAHIYVGTRDAWDQLTVAEKITYQFTAFLGDTESGVIDNVPTENSENLVKSGGVYSQGQTLATNISNLSSDVATKANQTLLAPIQTTLVASKNYAIGDQFVYNGLLYRVTATITQGSAITIGGNCEQAPDITHQMSYVGMIIHSTVLDTQDKVKKVYGGTTWIQHSGYFLRGAATGVVANSAAITGGDDNSVLIRHRHKYTTTYKLGTTPYTAYNGDAISGNDTPAGQATAYSAIPSQWTDHEGSDSGTNKNIPKYKSVYIWERTA